MTTIADYLLFAFVYFFQGALGLVGIAMPLFMREELGLSIVQISMYSGIMAWPWVIKPLYGLISDYLPLFGYRRKSYVILSLAFAVVGWLMTAQAGTLTLFLFAQFLVAIGIASLDVFTDGLAVQKSTRDNRRFIQALCWGSRSVGAIFSQALSGYVLYFFSYQTMFLIVAMFPLLLFGIVIFIQEKSVTKPSFSLKAMGRLGKNYMNMKKFWWIILFLFAFFATPSFSKPLFFYLTDKLGFSPAFIGFLDSGASIGGVIGALFAFFWPSVLFRKSLVMLIVLNMIATASYFFVFGTGSAVVVYFINGLVGYFTLISCMTLITTICPKGSEATTFALVTGIVNFAGSVLSPILGGWIFLHVGLSFLIIFSAASHLVALLIVQLMPEEENYTLPKLSQN